MVWIKVLDQNKCHAIIGWQRGEKFPACIEPAGGSANSNNRETSGPGRRPARGRPRLRCGLFSLVWSTVCHSGYFL
jgi:hypothetical protein